MTRMLDILEIFLNLHGYTYMRLDGATKPEQRQALMERFNADDKYLHLYFQQEVVDVVLILLVQILLYFMILIGILLWIHKHKIDVIELVKHVKFIFID